MNNGRVKVHTFDVLLAPNKNRKGYLAVLCLHCRAPYVESGSQTAGASRSQRCVRQTV